MNKITCEMCGGNDIIKQENFFVCQSCGTKYSPEEAKKLIIEGTVKVDNSDRLSKWLDLARRAQDAEDFQNSEKYYTLVLEENPNNWEAFFYSLYSRANQCTIAEIGTAIDLVTNNLYTVFSMIKEQTDDYFEQVASVASKVIQLQAGFLKVADSHYRQYSDVQGAEAEYVSRRISILNSIYTLGNALEYYFPQDKRIMETAVKSWISGNILANKWPLISSQIRDQYTNKIRKYQPNYSPPPPYSLPPRNSPPRSPSTCYIATCVYGSYDCPNVWILRRFRDKILAPTSYGKAFIKIYYLLSPTLVKYFGKTNWFKTIFRKIIDRILFRLQAKGVENTPYFDL